MFGMNMYSGISDLSVDIFWIVAGLLTFISCFIILVLLFRYRLTGTTPEIKATLKKTQ
jgi:hypothetical protein